MTPTAALAAGLIAGLTLAVPLGAIGVLLVQEGASRGFARGAPAAIAVATVDLLYCAAAVIGGAVLAPVIKSWAPWPRVIGGAALLTLAAWNLIRLRRSRASHTPAAPPRVAGSAGRYALFLGLTALNPATLLYFAAIVSGLTAISTSSTTALLFVAGVAAASVSWQLLLVLAGALLRRRTGARFEHLTTLIGNAIVGLLGIFLLTGLI